jgi:shikimate dehydrogenase
MKDWSIDRDTRLLISASSAPSQFGVTVYNALFRRRGVNAVYLARKATDAGELVRGIRALGVAGASVSMPLKHAIVEHLDDVVGDAAVVRSVNTVVNEGGRLVGHNTDVAGFRGAIAGLARPPAQVVVEGSGSVVDSILYVLAERGWPAALRARNEAAAAVKRARWGAGDYLGGACELWVNATPLSLSPLAPELRSWLGERRPTVVDLVVPLKGNSLAAACAELGLTYVPGFAMYQHQFLRQFELYTGLVVEPDEVRAIAVERGLV